MAKAGQCISNPATGERAVVRVGDEDPDFDGVLVSELFLAPGGQVSIAHVHPEFTERFTPISGDFTISLDGAEQAGEHGRTYHVRPGMAHEFWNGGDTEAHIVVEVEPPGRFEDLIRNLFGLAHDGKTNPEGQPGALQLAAVLDEYDDVLYPASPPRPVQRALIPALAAVARWRGIQGSYQRYLSWEGVTIDVDPWSSPTESALPESPPDSAFVPPGSA